MPNLIRFLGGRQVQAMAFFPFVLVRHRDLVHNKRLIRHEKIHWRQQVELALVFFYLLYFVFYVYYRIKKYNHDKAYRQIPFEREAYRYDSDAQYLKKRRYYQWFFELTR